MMSKSREPRDGEDQLAYASLIVHGGGLQPKFWTDFFGIEPTRSAIKGERFITPSGKLSSSPARIGVWKFSTELSVRSDQLNPHLEYLVAKFGLPRADLLATLVLRLNRMVQPKAFKCQARPEFEMNPPFASEH